MTATNVLTYAAGTAQWWVDYAGQTYVGERDASNVPASAYSLLDYNASDSVAVLAVDDLFELTPGRALMDERLSAARVIRDVEVRTQNGSPLRATVWLGTELGTGKARLASLMHSVVKHVTAGALFGAYKYRVVKVRADKRLDLQAVRAASQLPDLLAVSQWPGYPGVSGDLALGSHCVVMFIDGDPAQPIVTHYAGPDGVGFAPVAVTIGDTTGAPAARQGDTVEVLLPPAQFAGTVNGLAASGVVTWLAPKADGIITGGSGRVKVAT